ncbi:MAG: ferritin-like domain-containing protein [Gemmatimonadales bacterium]
MTLNTLQDLMVDNLKDLYNAERQILGALPRLAKAAKTPALKEALESHRRQTETHVARLEEVFGILELPARGKACRGMEGLIAEGKEVLGADGEDPVRDAGIIAAAQKVEHYEIAAYGSAATYAQLLGQEDVARLLGETLDEEKAADEKLSALAEGEVNDRAMRAGGESEGETEDPESEVEDTGRASTTTRKARRRRR